MTATLSTTHPSAIRATHLTALPSFEGESRGHLPRSARRVPLQVVAAAPAASRPTVAVYRRRQLLALAAACLILIAVAGGLRAGVAWLGGEATAGGASPAPTVLVAEPGDTYWSLAGRLYEGGDIRSVVDSLVAANGGRALRAGDRLVLAG